MKAPLILLGSLITGVILVPNLGQGVARAADHLNLEEGLPIEVEDAYPVPFKGRELQLQTRFEQTEDNEDRFVIEPRFEYGFAPNWQARITVPFLFGEAEEDDIGNVGLEFFYNFNAESLKTPAFAVSVSADFPTAPDSAGVDPTVKFIATKTLGPTQKLDRLNLNVALNVNTERQDEERSTRVETVLGYSRRLGPETMLLTDFVFEQEEEEDKEAFILELGIRHQTTPLSVLSIGAGAGLTEESPDFRITFGFQQSI